MSMFPIYADFFATPWFIILVLLAFFGIIVFAVIMLKKHSSLFKDEEGPKSEAEVVEEELDRVLESVEDEKAAEEMANFDQEEATKDETSGVDEELGEDKPLEK